MRVAIYARVSTTKQDEAAQVPVLRRLAEARGYEVVREYSDEASAKDANRPGWRALMQDASEHAFDAILVTKLDRVMRSLVQLNLTLMNLETYGVKLICADIGELDYSSPMGKVQLQIIGAIAEWEREIIVQRTKEGIAARKAKGVRMGRRRRDDIPIAAVAALRMDGSSWASIAEDLRIPKTTLLSRKSEVEAAIKARSKRAP
ncbi:MAG: recombinase family protein [Candidatus Methanomethylophilaceae archaeon]|nr:recombinase family protein [Candidatus Methanomethylophilaceae archaeon]MBR6037434.1 recombinase family protein [Candidatus Methanomethylophilaceae archaeon]MBR6870096.1 recombinase family protein [Candidatus Methanomethylophilaceae archaeon]